MASFLGSPKVQYFKTGTAEFLNGGKLYSYDAGTSTPRPTYPTIADALAGTNANTNPVILDSRGEANIVVQGSTKLILKDADDNLIWTVDNVDQDAVDVIDQYGNELLKFVATASAVNEWTVYNAASGGTVRFEVTGGDTNVIGRIKSKGNSSLELDGGSSGTLELNKNSTGQINARSNVSVTGSVTTTTSITAGTTLTATGNTTCNGTLTVAGATAFNGGVTTTGPVNIANGNIASTTTNQNITLTPNGTGKVVLDGLTYPAADGTAGQAIKTSGAGVLSFGQCLVQQVYGSSVTYAAVTTLIPLDDTIPQNTEGDQIITASITPTNSSNLLLITAYVPGVITDSATAGVIALFQDSTADALAAATFGGSCFGLGADVGTTGVLRYRMTAGTTSSTTFRIRVGPSGGGSLYVNGNGAGRRFGGVSRVTLLIEEYSQ